MVLIRISSGTATMAPIAPHIQPSRAMVTNTATVLSAQRRLTNVGVTNCNSAKWMAIRMRRRRRDARPVVEGQQAHQRHQADHDRRADEGHERGDAHEGTPHIMALGKPSRASATVASNGNARIDDGEREQVMADAVVDVAHHAGQPHARAEVGGDAQDLAAVVLR